MTAGRPPALAPAGRPHPATLHPFASPDYRPPDADDVRAVFLMLGKTEAAIALLVGVQPRAARAWVASPTAKTRKPITYAAWRLLLIAAKLIKPSQL